jgi:preprotein translocase subunit SecE
VARTEVAAPEAGGRLAGAGRAVVEYVQASRAELGKVTWPTREELVTATRVVVILAVALGLVIGLADWVLGKILVDGVAALAR